MHGEYTGVHFIIYVDFEMVEKFNNILKNVKG